GPGKFHNFAGEDPAAFAFLGEMKDEVFRRARLSELSGKTDPHRVRNTARHFIVFPDAGNFGIADSVRKTVKRSGRTRVRVGAANHLAGKRNLFAHDRVTYTGAASARRGVVLDTRFFGHALLSGPKILNSRQSFFAY